MNKNSKDPCRIRYWMRKKSLVMKLCVLFTFLFSFSAVASTHAQQERINLDLKDVSLKTLFGEIQKQTSLSFVYNTELTSDLGVFSIQAKDEMVKDVLQRVLANTGLTYKFEGDIIIIRRSESITPDKKEEKAKPITVTGKVTDKKTKHTLPGVTVQVKGVTLGTVTGIDGKYKLTIPNMKEFTLLFTFVGMKTQEIKYVGKDTINVVMEEDISELDEVNVVSTGYGDVDRRRLTSAVTSLKMDDIMVAGLNSVDQMLEGRIPGMIFMQNSGQVGATPRVRIRGNSTIIGNQEPLWVVDGIVQSDPVDVDPAQLNDLDFVNLLGNAISGLNPEDIERIDVLKDAAATAIYGTRAANGVIVITTKKGKVGPPTVSYAFTGTFTRRPYYTDKAIYMMNSKERVEASRELFDRQIGFTNVGVFVGYEKAYMDYSAGRITYKEFQELTDYYETVNTDWFDILTQNSFSHKHTLSLSGGSPNIRYYASVGYNDQRGVIKKEAYDQLTANLKLDGTFDELQFQFTMNFNTSKKDYTPTVDGTSVIQYAYQTNRALPAYNPDGTRAFYQKDATNRMESDMLFNMEHEMEKTYQDIESSSVGMTGMVKYRFWDVLNVEGTVSYSFSATDQTDVYEEGSFYVTKLRGYSGDRYNMCPVGGEWNNTNTRNNSWVARLQLNYGQTFGDHGQHYVVANLGGEISSKKYYTVKQKQRGYYPDRGLVFGTISDEDLEKYVEYAKFLLNETHPTLTEKNTNLGSVFLSATYAYNNLYTINFNTRADISNQFGSRSREKLLPIWSVSGRWDIARQFWADNANVNELALKLSYGHQGNMIDGQTSKMIINKDTREPYFGDFFSTVDKFPNPDLKWETTASYNAEVVFSLLRNKISGSLGYYYKKTTDAFLTKTISTINGRRDYVVNEGNLENQGVEVALSFMPFNQQVSANGKRGFVWRFDPQIGQVVNKLISKAIDNKNNIMRDEVTYQDFLNGNVDIAGEPMETFYSYKFTGLHPEDGSPTFYGMDRENYEELKDKYNKMTNEEVILEVMEPSGTRVPVLQGGFSNYFGYRQFGLSFNFTYSLGNKIRMLKLCENYNVRPYPHMNIRKEFVDRWRKPGDEKYTNIPGFIVDELPSGRDNWKGWWKYGDEEFDFGSGLTYYSMYDYSNIRVIKGDYLKLQSISLRYNVEDKFCKKLGIKSAYVSLSGTNLFTIQDKRAKGMDVTSQSGSASTINLSIRPSYSMSLNITF